MLLGPSLWFGRSAAVTTDFTFCFHHLVHVMLCGKTDDRWCRGQMSFSDKLRQVATVAGLSERSKMPFQLLVHSHATQLADVQPRQLA